MLKNNYGFIKDVSISDLWLWLINFLWKKRETNKTKLQSFQCDATLGKQSKTAAVWQRESARGRA